jgi:hypothetical protein
MIITSTSKCSDLNVLKSDDILNGTIPNENIVGRTKLKSSSVKGDRDATLNANGYIHILTTDTISNIMDPTTAFPFGYTNMGTLTLTIDGTSKKYNYYRSAHLIPGKYQMKIS